MLYFISQPRLGASVPWDPAYPPPLNQIPFSNSFPANMYKRDTFSCGETWDWAWDGGINFGSFIQHGVFSLRRWYKKSSWSAPSWLHAVQAMVWIWKEESIAQELYQSQSPCDRISISISWGERIRYDTGTYVPAILSRCCVLARDQACWSPRNFGRPFANDWWYPQFYLHTVQPWPLVAYQVRRTHVLGGFGVTEGIQLCCGTLSRFGKGALWSQTKISPSSWNGVWDSRKCAERGTSGSFHQLSLTVKTTKTS